MAQTTIALYRRGNSLGPRMTHVRIGKDVLTYDQNGIEFVRAHSGGISTFASPGLGRNWWVLLEGSTYPDDITIINDHGDHYSWEPNVDMPLADFVAHLATVEPAFARIS